MIVTDLVIHFQEQDPGMLTRNLYRNQQALVRGVRSMTVALWNYVLGSKFLK